MNRVSILAAALALPVALSACSRGPDPEVVALRNQVGQLQAELDQTKQSVAANEQAAQLAQQQAARARQEATIANERAETMYNRSLRK